MLWRVGALGAFGPGHTLRMGEAMTVLVVGVAAGAINTIVGSGTLVTFPTLLAIGYSPVVANVSNTIGLVFGSVSGAVGYRRELRGQGRRLLVLGAVGGAGGLTGGVLLLVADRRVFGDVVPVLILGACALVAAQPRLSTLVAARRPRREHGGLELALLVFLTGIYGGYFGAAQGVVLLALLGIFLTDDLQRLNGAKNVVVAIVNGVAAVLFVFAAHVAWPVVGLLALGSVAGGQLGARVGRRLPAPVLRAAIILVGGVAALRLIVG